MIKTIKNEAEGNSWRLSFMFEIFGLKPKEDSDLYVTEQAAILYLLESKETLIKSNVEIYINRCLNYCDDKENTIFAESYKRALSCLSYIVENKCDLKKSCYYVSRIEKELFNILPSKKDYRSVAFEWLNKLISFCKKEIA